MECKHGVSSRSIGFGSDNLCPHRILDERNEHPGAPEEYPGRAHFEGSPGAQWQFWGCKIVGKVVLQQRSPVLAGRSSQSQVEVRASARCSNY
ncbi:hypothetical protein TMatcc_003184 [Talaromyces marneffei ATCC 18224]